MPRDAPPAFVGRHAELEQLEAAWERAAGGEPSVVLIAGDAGMGKTRLVEEFVAAHSGAARIARGGCVPIAGGSLPYVPFVAIIRDLVAPGSTMDDPDSILGSLTPASRAELARLVPAVRSPSAAGASAEDAIARARLFEALLGLLARAAERAPVLMAIEDLHWADGSSLDLLGYLVRNLRTEPVLVLATYRSDELHRRHPLRPWTAEIGRLGLVERLELGRLDADDLRRDVAAMLAPDADPALIDSIVRRADGNPLFASELVAGVRRNRGPAAELPDTLRDGFLDRLGRLGPDALTVARHAAVIGRPSSEPLLAASTGLPADRLAAGIREALDAQVLVTVAHQQDDRFEPRHALLGEAIVDDLLPGERTALHRRLADLLEAGADTLGQSEPAAIAGEIAHHRWQAHDVASAMAASVRAAIAAADALAYAEADAHWTRALEAWPGQRDGDVPGEVGGLDLPAALTRAAEAAAALGDRRRAAELAEQALRRVDAGADPMRAAELHRRLFWYHLWGDERLAGEHADQAVRLLPADHPPAAAARILADRAAELSLRLQVDDAERIARRALELAALHERPDAEIEALMALGNCLVARSEHAAGLEASRRGFDLADRLGDAEGLMAAGNSVAWTLNDAGLSAEALEHCARFETRIQELGLARRYGSEMHDHRTWALLHLGRWQELGSNLEAFLASVGLAGEDRSPARASLARLRARQGRTGDARELATLSAAEEHGINLDPVGWSIVALREVALAEQRWHDVRHIVAAMFGSLPADVRATLPELRGFVIDGLLAEAELAFEGRLRHDRAAEAEAVRIARELASWARGLADRVIARGERLATRTLADTSLAAALLTRVERRPDPGAWRPALERYETLGFRFDVARTRRWLAEAILDAGSGHRSEAAEQLRAAVVVAAELGARPLEQEIRDLARRARLDLGTGAVPAPDTVPEPRRDGAADRRGDPTRTPHPGRGLLVESLTPRELEVLRYLSAGWTNRRIGDALFISDKTVSVHVSNLLGKLGAANRAEAALIGDRLGLGPPGPGPA